jgi:membrane-bound metal-dependent hydrolase YbcI (DUF457 family)
VNGGIRSENFFSQDLCKIERDWRSTLFIEVAMFIGHYAVALAAKKAAPKVSLGTLFIAVQLVDMLWPLFLLLGWEHARIDPGNTPVTPLDFYDYPITHSLVGAILWSCALGVLFYLLRKEARSAVIVGAGVFSHWILDFLTHRPDLPLSFRGGPYFGLGLWYSVAATLVVELALFIIGTAIYFRMTSAKDRIGSIGFWSLVGFLVIMYLLSFFGPPPPSVTMLAIGGNALWLFVFWAYWVDKHRIVKP